MSRPLRIEIAGAYDKGRDGKSGVLGEGEGAEHIREGENELICLAVGAWGYRHKEVADYLGLQYSTVSRLLKEREMSINKADPHARKEEIAEAARVKLDVVRGTVVREGGKSARDERIQQAGRVERE